MGQHVSKVSGVWILRLVGMFCLVVPGYAGMVTANIFFNQTYTQTTSGVSFTGDYFLANGTMQTPTDFATVTLSYPGPNFVPMAINGVDFSYQTGLFTDDTLFHNSFSPGSYDFVGNATTQASISYTQDLYDTMVPTLTAASFNRLQNLDPTFSPTINFNLPGTATEFTTFSILDSSGNVAYTTGPLPNTIRTIVLPANILLPGSQYMFDLDFSNQMMATSMGVSTIQGFDVRTNGDFSTAAGSAIPEPTVLTLLAIGAVIIGLRRRSRYD